MDVVEFFIAVAWTEDEGEQRVLRSEEEDNRKLRECKKTFKLAYERQTNMNDRSNAYPHG